MKKLVETRVAVVTGASSGIGKEAAKALAGNSWKVIGLGRNPERCAAAKAEICIQAAQPDQVSMICADLSLMSDVKRAAKDIEQLTDRVDALLNNAGGVSKEQKITVEGNEATFTGNHLGHFLLTKQLLPLLRAAAATSPAGSTRIVSVSSTGHEHCTGLDWGDLQMMNDFVSGTAYCRAKLANLLFIRELSKRLAEDGITAHSMHPGVVLDSNFINHADDGMQSYMSTLKDSAHSPADAADTLIWLVSADKPGQSTGEYFYQRVAIPSSPAAQDDAAAERLWSESEALVQHSLNA